MLYKHAFSRMVRLVFAAGLVFVLGLWLWACGGDNGTAPQGGGTPPLSISVIGVAERGADGDIEVIVAMYRGSSPVSDAIVTVSGNSLAYGLVLTFDEIEFPMIPVYYGSVFALPGDALELRVEKEEALVYSASETMPGPVHFIQPSQGQVVPVGQDLYAQWTRAENEAGYWLDYVGADDSYYGVFTTDLSWMIPSTSLRAGESLLGVSALSDDLGLRNGEVFEEESESEPPPPEGPDMEEAGEALEGFAWVALTLHELLVHVDETAKAKATMVALDTGLETEPLTVASSSYKSEEGIELKENVYNYIRTPARGVITFHLRFDRWCIAVGGVVLLDGQTGQVKYQWQKERVMKPEREKYGFEIPAQMGDVLVIYEKHVDTIWGPTFNPTEQFCGRVMIGGQVLDLPPCAQGFCLQPAGGCDNPGTCVAKPSDCSGEVIRPVCGCDGQSYLSFCHAYAAGVSVASDGGCPCGLPGQEQCPVGMFCMVNSSTYTALPNGSGTCTSPAQECTYTYPVCGCDNKTYATYCDAIAAGVSIRALDTGCCGLAGMPTCAGDTFCKFEPEAQCGTIGIAGYCKSAAEVCSSTDPAVCGCDGRTYENKCEAWYNRTSVASEGGCQCGLPELPDCQADQFCKFSPEAKCGTAGIPGVCSSRQPKEKCQEQDPVCGCDRKTYNNWCEATKAGVSVAHDGAC